MRVNLFNLSFKVKASVRAADAMMEEAVEEINEAIIRACVDCLRGMGFGEMGATMSMNI